MPLRFDLKHYTELNIDELYTIMRLRQRVFVLEQNCPFVDCDDLDQPAWHLMCYGDDSNLIAYSRLLPMDAAYPGYVSIGRVVSEPELRKKGYGRLMMEEGLTRCRELFGDAPIKIAAQLYLKGFYESYGFKAIGDIFLWDGIDHIYMIRE